LHSTHIQLDKMVESNQNFNSSFNVRNIGYQKKEFVEKQERETTFVQEIPQQQQQIYERIVEPPVLDRVEKKEHIDLIRQKEIHEKHLKDVIEVHEKPIEKQIQHAPQEVRIQEQDIYEIQGRDIAESERQRVFRQLEEEGRHHKVIYTEEKDVREENMQPIVKVDKELTKEIVERPIVTEIHHQPIKEIHQQHIHKTVYEPPVVTTVRDPSVTEQEYAAEPVPIVVREQIITQVQAQPIPTTVLPATYDYKPVKKEKEKEVMKKEIRTENQNQ
jgi:hypothetical protein